MNKSMKPSQPVAGKAPALTPEQKEEMIKRQFMQKRASLAEGVVFNMCQRVGLGLLMEGVNPKDYSEVIVDTAVEIADRMMSKLYGQEIVVKETEA